MVRGVFGGFVGFVGLSVVVGFFVMVSVILVFVMIGFVGIQVFIFFNQFFENFNLGMLMEQLMIYVMVLDGLMVELVFFYEQNCVLVIYEQVVFVLYDVIFLSEDKNFYSYGGINIGVIVKVLVDNVCQILSCGVLIISQQFVKNVLIQECEKDVDILFDMYFEDLQVCWIKVIQVKGVEGIECKLQEMCYVIQIEKDVLKNDIFFGYLNIVNFGGIVYGIEVVVCYYFFMLVVNFIVVQVVMFVGIVQNLNIYWIDKCEGIYIDKEGVVYNGEVDGYKDIKDCCYYVFGCMLVDGKIMQVQYDEVDVLEIILMIMMLMQGCVGVGCNVYFCQYVKLIVENDEVFGVIKKDCSDLLCCGGLKIYIFFDFCVQDLVVQIMVDVVFVNFDNKYFGVVGVLIEVGIGCILLIMQNIQFFEILIDDQVYFFLVFVGDQKYGNLGGFQVGLMYKLFIFIDWFEKGYLVCEVFNGVVQMNLKILVCEVLQIIDMLKIGNFGCICGYMGFVMNFIVQLFNSGFFVMVLKFDVCDINKVVDKMGVIFVNGGKVIDENVLYDILGLKNILFIVMVNVYVMVVSGGMYCILCVIDKVIDVDGKE